MRISLVFAVLALAACGAEGTTVPMSECASGMQWTGGDSESSLMHPGYACINCHNTRGGPRLEVAGTVFGAAHEKDDCFGISGVSVVITGSDGKVTTLTTNEAGNFDLRSRGTTIALPYTAKIVQGTNTRAMGAPQMSGDCASCHSAAGSQGAPGRISFQ